MTTEIRQRAPKGAVTDNGMHIIVDRGWTAWEESLESAVISQLQAQGKDCLRQVQCAGGRIDILTDTAIYELKHEFGRDAVLKGIGQLLVYGLSFSQHRRYLIAAYGGTGYALREQASSLGVEIVGWDGGEVPV